MTLLEKVRTGYKSAGKLGTFVTRGEFAQLCDELRDIYSKYGAPRDDEPSTDAYFLNIGGVRVYRNHHKARVLRHEKIVNLLRFVCDHWVPAATIASAIQLSPGTLASDLRWLGKAKRIMVRKKGRANEYRAAR